MNLDRNNGHQAHPKAWLFALSLISVVMTAGCDQISDDQKLQTVRQDMREFATFKPGADEQIIIPSSFASRNPTTRAVSNVIAERNQLVSAYNDAAKKSGLVLLANPADFVRDRSALNNCGAMKALISATDKFERDMQSIVSKLVSAWGTELGDYGRDKIKQEVTRELQSGQQTIITEMNRNRRIIDLRYKSCLILAKRNWQVDGNMVAFTNDADLREFNALVDQTNIIITSASRPSPPASPATPTPAPPGEREHRAKHRPHHDQEQ